MSNRLHIGFSYDATDEDINLATAQERLSQYFPGAIVYAIGYDPLDFIDEEESDAAPQNE